LLEQGQDALVRDAEGTGRRKLLIALLCLHKHVLVHPDAWAADNDSTALNYFDALVDWKHVAVGNSF